MSALRDDPSPRIAPTLPSPVSGGGLGRGRGGRGARASAQDLGYIPQLARLAWHPRDGRRPLHGDHGCPDRDQLADADPGRAGGKHRRDQLGPNRLPDCRRRDGAAVGNSVAAVVDPRPVRDRGARLHRGERIVRHRNQPRPDDCLSRAAGVQRRRDDAVGVSRRLYEIPNAATGADHGADRADPEPLVDFGSDDRRLFDRYLFLALAIPRKYRARHRRRRRRMGFDRHRQARGVAVASFRSDRSGADGALSRLPPIRASGRPALGLAFGRHDPRRRDRLEHRLRPVLLARADLPSADRRSARLYQSQLRARLVLYFRGRHRPLRHDLSDTPLSRTGAGLQQPPDR